MSYDMLSNKILEMKDEIIASVQQNMRIDSVRGETMPEAPYGIGPKKALEDALELGKRLGFRTGHADHRVGWVEFGEGEEMVGILGHVDVVPAGDGWTYPPFGAEIHDGMLWGRGCLDDKGPIIGAIYALKAIRDLGLTIDRRIRVLFGSDEECGSSCAKYYVENGYELPTIGFTPDADFPLIYCEKGMTQFKLGGNLEKGNIEVEYFGGGMAANVVMPTCKLIVKGELKVTDTEGVEVTYENGKTIVLSTGKSAHGSTPQLGVNAGIQLLNAVKENNFGGGFQKFLEYALNCVGTEYHGESMGVCFEDKETGITSLNLGVIACDGEHIDYTLDIRYPINGTSEMVQKAVGEKAAEYGFEVYSAKSEKILYVPKDSELVTKLMKVYRTMTGDEKTEPLAIGGGTYAKCFKNMVAFGPVFLGDPDVIHQPDERVEIDKFMKSLQIIASAMYELAKK